jgi:PPOX class probable F420-dependent enzyme
MTPEEWRSFLAAGTRTGKLSTVRPDGSPHVVPVWFVLDGDDLVLTTGRETAKGRNLVRDGRAALCVDDERPPFGFVTVWGRTRLSGDPAEVREWAGRIGARYMGEDRADEYGERNAAPGEILVRLTPEKVVALADVAD